MSQYSDADAPPEEVDAPAIISPCRICVTEEFVKSDQFDILPSLLQGCRGEVPLEISVRLANGMRRRWRVPAISVNPGHVAKHVSILTGASMEE